ncbi:Non-ribosomal peptide synthetase [Halomicronema hongdechloris C2206]|uniref:Non-ribosomal peptide synthetase n=1 Tax=Halomicronema hongdechloris C2206 TaxID=1641165 RepID=A0A1Z3HL86_9CYAN|nr:non-ribosomal peptide synthetase [Halomicronema hongdechloris]ASC71036.1 Non-ribosomal peptide synthetase [Halomicronema hongdechloris C2206]
MDNIKDKILNRRSKLSSTQRELLEKRLRGEVNPYSKTEIIPKRSQTGPAPLSFAQQRLWFLHQLDPGNPYYSEPACIKLTGTLNVNALEHSLNEIVRRHEALRTTFEMVAEQAVQIIHPTISVVLPVVNLRSLSEAGQKAEIEQLTKEIAQKPFDLAVGPLLRAILLQTDTQEYLLLFAIHHIAIDGWSIGVLIRELAILYEAFSTGKTPPLSELPIQYADFAVWQRHRLRGKLQQTQLSYWQQQLAGASALNLPTDRPRPPIQSFQGAVIPFELSASLSDRLRSLSNQEGVTLFMTLLVAFQALLYRYTGQEDICVGSPIANRNQSEIQKLIGFFANTLVLRTHLSGNPNLLELLNRVREVCVGAYAHADIPFEQLVEELQPERNLSHMPLFQVMFAWQEDVQRELTLPGLTLDWLPVHNQAAKFDLTLYMVDSEPEVRGALEYSTALFNPETATRIVKHFRALLEGIVVNPQARLSDLPLLGTDELHQLLVGWNHTEVTYPQQQCIHELFEAQVERTPEAVALVFEQQHLTYDELNRRANQLAHYLQGQGVGPETLVGVCLERSVAMVIALLGVLKAGGAYVPLDPSHPQERLAYILEDAQARCLLTQAAHVGVLPTSVSPLCLDTDWDCIAESPSYPPAPVTALEQLSYVIYTSGSTGAPKGVQIPHQALSNFLYSMAEYPGLRAEDRLVSVTTVAFDIAALELYLPLLQGARLEVVSREVACDAHHLARRLEQFDATVLQATPATWQMLMSTEWSGSSALLVFCGGDALPLELAHQLYARSAGVWNLYGPTETTIWSAVSELRAECETVPLGQPIANTQLYVLDKAGQPTPIGVPGELHIGGMGLARGYYQRPELTAERFVPNPFSPTPGARLYKTGDLVKYCRDGSLEYLGRLDHQVKLRGFRIELGEIETVLLRHSSVSQAVVVAHQNASGEPQLVGYVVPATASLSPSALRRYLQEQLPDYMVPAAMVLLKELPLTPNGKVDRKALPAPEYQHLDTSATVAARTPIEAMLVSIWADVLKLETVSIQSNFFELGGHSLLATRVMSHVRHAFAVEVPLRRLFEHPTIAELAPVIEAALHEEQGLTSPPITTIERSGPLPLSFAQQRLWFLAQLEPESPFYHLSSALRLHGSLDIDALQASLQILLQRHEALRLGFVSQEGHPAVDLHPTVEVPLAVIDLQDLTAQGQEQGVQQLTGSITHQPFSLDQPPLLRVVLLQCSQQEQVLVFAMHHIVSDGWSMGILVREVAQLYGAIVTGHAPSLSPLPVQYLDYAAWQRQWLHGEVLEQQRQYWQQQLAGAPEVLELPTDHPRPAVQTFRGATQAFGITPELTQGLKQLSRQQNCTLFMTLLAAFQVVLSRYSGQADIVVGSPIANRTRREVEGLIGFFVNTLVLRTSLAGQPSFVEVLQRVREVTLGAYAHQDMPFEQVVELLQPERALSHSPLFQVMFILQNAPQESLALPGVAVEVLESAPESAKFDLTLSLQEGEAGLQGQLEYNTDLFAAATMARLITHLQQVLTAVVRQPEQRVSDLPLLTSAERQRLLVEWNQTEAEYPEACLHELFEAQVERTPEAVALVFEQQHLTYDELNRRANQLAHYLQGQGVGPETLVGVCLERSVAMVIALLGVLKAGGAYVPLDPSHPQERLAYILEDAQARCLLTQAAHVGVLPTSVSPLCLDTDWDCIAESPSYPPAPVTALEQLSYVIYTSGSTGAPKGVQIPHQALSNFLYSMAEYPGLRAEDRLVSVTTVAFDIAALELYLPLLQGARLEVVSREVACDAHHLARRLEQFDATVLQATPATWQMLMSTEWSGSSALRVFCGGDALPLELAHQLHARSAGVWNLYGPTETTIWSAVSELTAECETVPLGRPIANTQVYVLDKAGQPTPIGVPGELHIGGLGLARGYYQRPALTAEQFVPNPFSPTPGARLYKTGDLVKYRRDGSLEYLGRLDHQVKLRGFRIELGEIETVLLRHPAISQAVVVAHQNASGEPQLVGYVVPAAASLSPSALRSYLQEQLPDYMVPAAMVLLEELPLTPNGKVDRKGLAKLNPNLDLDTTYRAPTTELETIIADLWKDILHLDKVGIHHNFFDIGGHSLLVVAIHSKLQNKLQREFPLISLFKYPTVGDLAQYLSQTAGQSNLIREAKPSKKKGKASIRQQKHLRQRHRETVNWQRST